MYLRGKTTFTRESIYPRVQKGSQSIRFVTDRHSLMPVLLENFFVKYQHTHAMRLLCNLRNNRHVILKGDVEMLISFSVALIYCPMLIAWHVVSVIPIHQIISQIWSVIYYEFFLCLLVHHHCTLVSYIKLMWYIERTDKTQFLLYTSPYSFIF